MTSFIANQVGGAFTPLVAKDKGDIANRAKCSGAQLVNNAQMAVCDTVVLGGAAAVVTSAKNGGKLAKVVEKGVSKFAQTLRHIGNKMQMKELKKLKIEPRNGWAKLFKNPLQKVADTISKMPGKTKIAAAIIAVATPLLAYIHGRHLYRQGQIDQKYTDRAAVEKFNAKPLG